jgi:hypothetical protein
MKMRSLSTVEQTIIEQMADKMPEALRSKLLSDLEVASVIDVQADGARILFAIENYEHPIYRGQHSYGVEGRILDEDGAEISVILYADEENHLFELEFVRWGEGGVKAPNLETFEVF